jgi:hypothetical protein
MWSFFLGGGNNNNNNDNVDDNDNDSNDSSSTSSSSSSSSSITSSIAFANIVTGCSKSNHTQYLEHGEDTWTLLQQAHDRVKGKRSHYKAPHTGMMVPFEIRSAEESSSSSNGYVGGGDNARYLYVTEDVKEGTQLWKPIHYHTFHSQQDYVNFLIEVGEHYLQCEVLSWTHPSYQDENDMYSVDITLDEGTFIDETTSTSMSQEKANIDINCRAIREIKAGEKIIMNGSTEYSNIINKKEIDWFNDIKESAWKRTGLGIQHNQQQQQQHMSRGRGMQQQQHTATPTPTLEANSNNFAITTPTTSMAVLSALFFVVKIIRGSRTNNKRSSSFSAISYGGDIIIDNDNGTKYSYFCNSNNNNKSKIA